MARWLRLRREMISGSATVSPAPKDMMSLTDCQKHMKITSLIDRIFKNGEYWEISSLIWI